MRNYSNYRLTRFIFLLSFITLLMNMMFVGLHYLGDLTPVKQAIFRINEGISHLNVVQEDYPSIRYGIQSTHVLVGLDQLTDCNIVYLMSMYRDSDKLKNAIVPGIAEPSSTFKNSTRWCERVIGLATEKYPQDPSAADTKARLWHGAKAVFLLLAPVLDIFQMKILMQQATYLLYFLIGISFTLYGYEQFLVFLPYGILGIMFSGVPYFGDLSNGLPYTMALICVETVLIIGRWTQSRRIFAIVLTVFGCLHAFFFVTDGAEMLAIPLLLLTLYFACLTSLSRHERLKSSILLVIVYVLAFAGSMVLKQIFSIFALGFHQVISEFTDAIILRVSNQMNGTHITVSKTLDVMFEYFLNDFFYVREIYGPVLYASMVAWSIGLSLLSYMLIAGRNRKYCFNAAIFVLAGFIVIARYVIMREHSYLHGAFVSRYLFVFLSSGWALAIYLLRHVRCSSQRPPAII